MTRDVCVCGHLEQTHDDGETVGPCHAPTCTCSAFVSEDEPLVEAA